MARKFVFLRITQDYTDEMVASLRAVAELNGYSFVEYNFEGLEALQGYLCGGDFEKGEIDVLLVGAHSNTECFASTSAGGDLIRWAEFADHLCGCNGLSINTHIFLGCCAAGSKRVALTLMLRCPLICSVMGTACSLTGAQASLALHVYLYNRERADSDIETAVSASIGVGFRVHSRSELDAELMQIELVDYLATLNLDVPLMSIPDQLRTWSAGVPEEGSEPAQAEGAES
ncbi:hypothetical protein [Amylibacter sp. IMCC11727]|uniref:hypothetical protein n=1 Tax=Amylibacter sp. IMCC11727 TaxID=3039851 RepID=UPI00244E1F41|nr:hypothetical protein [Amylibacter sp. IMCC11727]WGI22396.1 hypothetical protein QBD29_02980 [Amylibacter sp. IMCC11727]